jgi:hypothetical protein
MADPQSASLKNLKKRVSAEKFPKPVQVRALAIIIIIIFNLNEIHFILLG